VGKIRILPGSHTAEGRGFTTLEIIIVLVIAIIVSAIAAPNLIGNIQRYRVRSGADQVMSELRRIQSLAMTAGSRHRLTVGNCLSGLTPCKRYRSEREASGAWPAASDVTGTNSNVLSDWVDLQQSLSSSVRLKSLKDNAGSDVAAVLFDSRGASVTAGASYPLTFTIAHATGYERTVVVRSAGSVRMP
jgi:Tfp pilus assembly protein FimT